MLPPGSISQTANGVTTDYLWDEFTRYSDVVYETDTSGNAISYTLANGQLISQTVNTTTDYFLTDAQGSTRLLTDPNGAISATYDYDAFGELVSSSGSSDTNYLYTGQQYDPVTELYSLRARYYDASLGRFMSRDTYAYNYRNPVELNRYSYARNNPVNYTDPSGHQAMVATAIRAMSSFGGGGPNRIMGAVIGGATGAGVAGYVSGLHWMYAQHGMCGPAMKNLTDKISQTAYIHWSMAIGGITGAVVGYNALQIANFAIANPGAMFAISTSLTGIALFNPIADIILNNNERGACNMLDVAAALLAYAGATHSDTPSALKTVGGGVHVTAGEVINWAIGVGTGVASNVRDTFVNITGGGGSSSSDGNDSEFTSDKGLDVTPHTVHRKSGARGAVQNIGRAARDLGVDPNSATIVGPYAEDIPQGISTSEKISDLPPSNSPQYLYTLPEGTDLSEFQLKIIPDGQEYNGPHPGTHNSIYPATEMTLEQFYERINSLPWTQSEQKVP